MTHQEQQFIKEIVEHHQGLQHFPEQKFDPTLASSSHSIYLMVKKACLKLGFIEIDAECLAQAWLKMQPSMDKFNPKSWPELPQYFGIRLRSESQNQGEAFPNCPHELGLYVVAPDANWIKRLIDMGLKTIQLRFKSDNELLIEDEVKKAIEFSKNKDVRLFINDHWKLAIQYQAYGVHLGQEDLSEANLDHIRSAGLHLGLSTHGYAEMVRAAQFAPSYIALGAIFPTTLKRMATAPQGLGRLEKYAYLLKDYPLVGIGGVDESNIKQVLATGVGSAAVVRAIIHAHDPEAAFKKLNAYF
jgi:thiamine-phosphate pyrophosphorylase